MTYYDLELELDHTYHFQHIAHYYWKQYLGHPHTQADRAKATLQEAYATASDEERLSCLSFADQYGTMLDGSIRGDELTICQCLDLAAQLDPNFKYEPADNFYFFIRFSDNTYVTLQRDDTEVN